MIQLQEDKENSKKNNEEEDNGWDVGENKYEAGSNWRMKAVLAVLEGVFSGFIFFNDTTIFFSDI
ncbi:hypothetical protein LIS77_03865 [Cytobacillus firmus]|uniref:hypothetical protein n=1 Tax=Cytobacillus firmus TaxID=1399 RepID=UPI00207A01B8|nr:hypothetical protein [Cytobacillus firmus]USK39675.1 hypothetical protein LIS77_03865 [Cytobacillus firmus]